MSNFQHLQNIPIGPPLAVRVVQEQTHTIKTMMSGRSTFDALARSVQELRRLAPNDCDVWIRIGDILIREATFVEPHTFTFEGLDQHGDRAWVVQHFSQLSATVIFRTKREEKPFTSRVVHGFNPNAPAA